MCKAIWIFLTGRNDGDLWSDGTEEFQHCGILAAVMAHLSECRPEKKSGPFSSGITYSTCFFASLDRSMLRAERNGNFVLTPDVNSKSLFAASLRFRCGKFAGTYQKDVVL
jgi:hypothetical protein